jgi:acid phosphatase family membrane protein YuiD
MNTADAWAITWGFVQGFVSSSTFVLALFIGFCVLVGLTKLKRTSGGTARVVKSLDERISHQPMKYFAPTAPHGPADQLRAPELLEQAARK